MLLLTVVYEGEGDIISEISQIRNYFKSKNVVIGISESITGCTHFVKIFCSDDEYSDKIINSFNLYMANAIYKIVVSEFYHKEMYNFLTDTYFFLKNDEIKEVADESLRAFKGEGKIIDESNVYCINRKNKIVDKIVQCIEENEEININGFIRFRMKDLREDLECIIDKVVEKYMVDKEYSEFIKLLKYFVEVQDSKIDEVNIIISTNNTYSIKDDKGNDIMKDFVNDISSNKITESTNVEDIIISGLITNSPNKIKIHGIENCTNKELIETIKNVFTDRVEICTNSKLCEKRKQRIKL
jgi:putative sporulation protein YtxC